MKKIAFIILYFTTHICMAASSDVDDTADRIAALSIAQEAGQISELQLEAMAKPHYESIKETLDKLMTHYKSGITAGASVHALDAIVASEIGTLCSIGEKLDLDDGKMTADIIKSRLMSVLKESPDLFTCYEKTIVTQGMMRGYVDKVFEGLDPPVVSLYSRSLSLATRIMEENGDSWALNRIYDCIAENYLTSGGCYQGRRNRIFVLYARMLAQEIFNSDS